MRLEGTRFVMSPGGSSLGLPAGEYWAVTTEELQRIQERITELEERNSELEESAENARVEVGEYEE